MKAKLIFKLPEESKAFLAAAKADDMAIVLWDIYYNGRKDAMRQFEEREFARPEEVIDYIFNRIYGQIRDAGLVIDDLTE